jgi:hypothetical protein
MQIVRHDVPQHVVAVEDLWMVVRDDLAALIT